MLQSRHIVVRWGEIALKGRNRGVFVRQLVTNLRNALRDIPIAEVRRLSGRLWLIAPKDTTFRPEVYERLKLVYGIVSFSPMLHTPLEIEAMKDAALKVAQQHEYESYRVTARRSFKTLPLGSMEVNHAIGDHLWVNKPAKVKMKGADFDLRVEMVPQGAFISGSKIPGPRGLPVGVSGRVMVMLSGGIDSPVAAWRMMRRGCRVSMVHFHSHPLVSKASLEKAEDLAGILMRYQYEGRFHAVPFGELQRIIVEKAPPSLRVVLYRRFMVRIATALAYKDKCRALVTGDSLAQVASQTLTNLNTVGEASSMPILRPLIAYDKLEIEAEAQALGTYETSILPDQDCCSLFVPRSPETHAKIPRVREAEEKLDIEAMVAQALDASEKRTVCAPWWRERKRKRRGKVASPDSNVETQQGRES